MATRRDVLHLCLRSRSHPGRIEAPSGDLAIGLGGPYRALGKGWGYRIGPGFDAAHGHPRKALTLAYSVPDPSERGRYARLIRATGRSGLAGQRVCCRGVVTGCCQPARVAVTALCARTTPGWSWSARR